jgi:hypothetical protein
LALIGRDAIDCRRGIKLLLGVKHPGQAPVVGLGVQGRGRGDGLFWDGDRGWIVRYTGIVQLSCL